MKKIYISTIALLTSALSFNAQVFQVINTQTNPHTVMSSGDVVINETVPGTTAGHHFEMKNASSVTRTVSIRKTVVTLNVVIPQDDEARAYFCTGTDCYDASVMNVTIILGAGDTMSFTSDLDEATVAGYSEVNYKFSARGPADTNSVDFNVKYNPSPVGISKNSAVLSGVSSLFPNPTNGNAFVTINSDRELNGVQVSVINSLGARVSSKEVNLNNGKNVIALGTENLNAGIYFVSIRSGSTVVTKKLTVLN